MAVDISGSSQITGTVTFTSPQEVIISQADDSIVVYGKQDGSGTNLAVNVDASGRVRTDGSQVTQPISAASLPLPAGAATSALQTQPGVDIGDVTVNNTSGAGAVNIQDGGNSITVDGAVAATQSGTWNIGTITNVVHVDDNAGSLTVDNNGTFAVQATIAAGSAVIGHVITDSGSTTAVTGNVTVTQATGTNLHAVLDSGTLSTITNVVHVDDNAGSLTVDGTVAATQSGTWNINSVSGTVSLPTGAATAANQSTEITSLQSLDTKLPQFRNSGSHTFSGAVNENYDITLDGITSLTVKIAGIVLSDILFFASTDGTTFERFAGADLAMYDGQAYDSASTAGNQGGPQNDIFQFNVSGTKAFRFQAGGTDTATVKWGTSIGTPGAVSLIGNSFVTADLRDGAGTDLTSTLVSAKQSLDVNVTQSAAPTSLPLPTGAATETTLSAINTKTPSLGQAAMAASSPVVIASNQSAVPISGTVAATQSGAWSLSANQSVNVAQINGATPLMGAGNTGTGSTRVTIASDQASIPVAATLSAETTKVIGTVNISASQTVGISAGSAVIGHVINDASSAVIGHVITDSGSTTAVTGNVAVTIASGATSIAKAEDVASADADVGVPAMAIQQSTPADTAGTNGDYAMMQMSAGRLWTSSKIDTALPAGSALIGKTGIDQTTPGTTNAVSVAQLGANTIATGNGTSSTGTLRVAIASDNTSNTNAWKVDGSAVTQPVSIATAPVLVAGSALIGKVGIDQTTVGTTNAVSIAQLGANTVATGNGTSSTGTLRVAIASDNTTNSNAFNVQGPTLTKGTQGSTGFSIQPLTDAGRASLMFYATAAASGTTTTETAISLTKSSGTSATSAANSFVITNGKKFRITHLSVATRGNSTATIQTTTFNLRLNTGGAVTTSSTPIIFSARSATPATASAWDRYTLPIPEGFEITGDGTMQFGVTAAATFTTNAPTWDVNIIGYEY